MARTKGYSIWFMPSGEVYDRLAGLISTLSNKYGTPVFEPHVTLIGELVGPQEEVLRRTARLAAILKPCKIKLTSADYRNEYFRCLYVKVEEADDVLRANEKARQVFDRREDQKYEPHLSLMYCDTNESVKEEILDEVGREFDITFEVRSIHLILTEREPRDWYKIGEFALGRK